MDDSELLWDRVAECEVSVKAVESPESVPSEVWWLEADFSQSGIDEHAVAVAVREVARDPENPHVLRPHILDSRKSDYSWGAEGAQILLELLVYSAYDAALTLAVSNAFRAIAAAAAPAPVQISREEGRQRGISRILLSYVETSADGLRLVSEEELAGGDVGWRFTFTQGDWSYSVTCQRLDDRAWSTSVGRSLRS